MLETKKLVKIYKPKKGVAVKALNGVDLKFSDTGMVFILGKSGSGKSTLLNVLGGLDKYDDGEIIIKGVSSKKFKQRHFDSYRNTYVGFIFQEYNILNDFTVGANIALALELQGKKATNEEINSILKEVDLDGHGNRRPNELSGGQKQRVAIARALVKHPKIIMADEPTGALDSETGEQVFNTLKKLSKNKLVIVVSHDRDFATRYGDRIIELSDGQVISDVSLSEKDENPNENGIVYDGNTATISVDYRLTEEDRIAINSYLEKLEKGLKLEFSNNARSRKFVNTDNSSILSSDTVPFKLIKSKLSLKHSFKIGASGLKHKKFRLVMTIFLSCVAFTLFGLADTFSAYNHIDACTNSIKDSNVKYAALSKSVKVDDYGEEYWQSWNTSFSDEEIEKISNETGIEFKGVIGVEQNDLSFANQLGDTSILYKGYSVYADSFHGLVELDEKDLEKLGYKILAGSLPSLEKDELAISAYVYESFKLCGYLQPKQVSEEYDDLPLPPTDVSPSVIADVPQTISSYNDIVGKEIVVKGKVYKISGVIDTGFDWDRYKPLLEADLYNEDNLVVNFVLFTELESAVKNDYTGLMMVAKGKINDILTANSDYITDHDFYMELSDGSHEIFTPIQGLTYMNCIDSSRIRWIGEEKENLADDEIIVSENVVQSLGYGFYTADGDLEIDTEAIQNERSLFFISATQTSNKSSEYKIVGVIDENDYEFDCGYLVVVGDALKADIKNSTSSLPKYILGIMPTEKAKIEDFVRYVYKTRDDVKYELKNPVCFELDTVNKVLKMLSKVFMYIGIGFAFFASILLSNFIATSVSYKKQEIGILRAIGSRGNDVFRIFFAESFIIAMINFVISAVGVYVVTNILNALTRKNVGILITILNFDIRQVVLIFVISVGVAWLASFLPVKKIASKRPIDAIKNL